MFIFTSQSWHEGVCTSSLWEGHLLHLSGKLGREKGSPCSQLNLSLGQPASEAIHGVRGTDISHFPGTRPRRGGVLLLEIPPRLWLQLKRKSDFIICFKIWLPNRLYEDSGVNSYLQFVTYFELLDAIKSNGCGEMENMEKFFFFFLEFYSDGYITPEMCNKLG